MPTVRGISCLACSATLLALGGVALWGPNPVSVERHYADAFERIEGAAPAFAATALRPDPAHLHLSGLPAPAKLFSSGDIITLNAQAGGTVEYQVIEVRHLTLPGEAGSSVQGMMLVTATATRETAPVRSIRFIVDADGGTGGLPFGLTSRPHAL